MTDIYIAYSRQDRDRLRVVGDLLAQEGWDIWMDPADPKPDLSPIADLKLGWSKAILVLWSDSARRSEYVRSEAATGLYKNKLVQARIDGEGAPRPFDELETVDLSRWNGDSGDPNWVRLVAMLRNCAGEPSRPPVAKRAPPPAPPPRKPEAERPAPPPQARPIEPVRFADAEPPPRPIQPAQFIDPPSQQPQPQLRAVEPVRFAEPPPQARFVEPPPPPPQQPRYAEPPPPPRYAEPPAPPPRYAEPPPRYAEPPPPPRYAEPPPPPRYAEPDPGRYADVGERSRGSRPVEPIYRAPHDRRDDRRDERLDDEDFGGRRGGYAPAYNRSRRSFAAAPVVAAVVLIGSGIGLWLGDPFGWRGGGESESELAGIPTRALAEATKAANAEPATAAFEDSDESAEDWRRTDRKSVDALRDHVSAYPRASTAESARSALRVMDAQAWVKAVTADSEAAYRTYLKAFPGDGDVPGMMVQVAEDRLKALGSERAQAIEDIQRGLASLGVFDGMPNGQMDEETTLAMRRFAGTSGKSAPVQASATPRDLRAFAALVRGAGSEPRASAAVAAAVEADQQRLAQAQAASLAAAKAAAAAPAPGADSLAMTQQNRMAEVDAWVATERAGTVAAYQSFLTSYPASPRTADARAAIAKLNKPAPYSLDQLPSETKAAVEAARRAQGVATQRAAAARAAAQSADALTDAQTIAGADGDRYRAQISGGAPNGLGVRTRGAGPNIGDRYRGELRNGQTSGVGVYEYADNPGNATARAARYEGEHAGDSATGHGVIYWKSGDSFAGLGAGGGSQARGVVSYANGQRYEGEMANGDRQGQGVVWAADGSVLQAGRWARGELVEPAPR